MRLFFILLCTVLHTVTIQGGSQIFTQVINEDELIFKVKSIDEFFQRFNYEINYKGEQVRAYNDSIASDSIMKRRSLTTLLDFDKFLINGQAEDSISSEFLDYAMTNDIKLHYSDTTWYAEALSSFRLNDQIYPITFHLTTEPVKDVVYKWVIRNVESPFFSALTDTISTTHSIYPGAHGTSFITLPETINLNHKDVQSFYYKNYKPNLLTVFAYLVMEGKIKIQNVTQVIYHLKAGDYNITVERFEKINSYNNGWLISEISKNNN